MPSLEDKPWALRMALPRNTGIEVPMDDKCQECFELWSLAFKAFTWEALCKQLPKDAALRAAWQEAKQQQQQPADNKPNYEPASVFQVKQYSMEIERSFLCLSLKDLKKLSGLQKIPKQALQFLPTIRAVDLEGDGEETFFIFKDPSNPFRRCKLKMQEAHNMETEFMSPETHLWQGQGEHMYETQTKTFMDKAGVVNPMDKLTYLKSWDEFVEEKLSPPRGREEPAPSGQAAEGAAEAVSIKREEIDEDMEPLGTLVGPAAQMVRPQAQRWNSGSSLGEVLTQGSADTLAKARAPAGSFRTSPSEKGDGASTIGGETLQALDKGALLQQGWACNPPDLRHTKMSDFRISWVAHL